MLFFLPQQKIDRNRQTGLEVRSSELSSWIVLKLVLCSLVLWGSGFSSYVGSARGEDLTTAKGSGESASETRLSIPWEQFSTVVEQYGSGVLLPQSEFESLWKSAEENRKAVPEGVDPVVVERCDVEITLVDHQIQATCVFDLKQLGNGLQSWTIPLKQIGIDRATVGEKPARLGRLNGTGPVVLFLDGPGVQRIRLETRLPVVNSGRRLLFSLPQLNTPSGRIHVTLPASMNVWSHSGERLSDRVEGDKRLVEWIPDTKKDWEANVGPAEGPQNAGEDAARVRHWTETTLIGLFDKGELNWQGALKIHPLGESFQQLQLRLPKGFHLTKVIAEGLTDWNVSPLPEEQGGELLVLRFRDPIRTSVDLWIDGIATKAGDEDWTISGFDWEDGSPQLTRLFLGQPKEGLLQIRQQEGIRLEPLGGRVFEFTDPREEHDQEYSIRFLKFAPTSGKFRVECRSLDAVNQFAADIQSHTKLTTRGAEATTVLTLDALGGAPLPNEIRVDFPVEWTVTEVIRRPSFGKLEEQSKTRWSVDSEDASGKQLRMRIDELNVRGDRFIIQSVMPLSNWPLEQGVTNLVLPNWKVDSAYSTTGLLMVSAEEPIQYRPLNLQGLAPTAPLKAEGTTPVAELCYRISFAEYSGEIELTRYQSRLAVFSTTTAKLNRDKLHCRLESLLQVSGSGTREIQLSLPVECGNDLRFSLVGGENEVVSQSVAAGEEGRNNWTLKLKQRAIGEFRIVTEMFISRNDTAETSVPLVSYPTAERQSGQVIIDADAEQFLTVRGLDAIGRDLPEQGLSDLVTPASHALPDRIAAAYRVPGVGCSVVMTEQRFQSEILPGAICDQLALQTVMGGSTQSIHEAVWVVRHGRLQSFILKMGAEQELWSVQLDGHPVEINQSGENEVKIKVPVTEDPLKTSQIRILFGGKNSVVRTTSNWKGQAPEIVAEYSAKDRRAVEILDQDWMLFHPSELEIAGVEAPYQAAQQEQGSWFSWLWNIHLSRDLLFRLMFLGLVFFLVLVSWGIAELIRKKIEIGRVVPGLVVLAILSVLTALLLPPVQSARESSRRTQERNMRRQAEMELEDAMEARVSSSGNIVKKATLPKDAGKKPSEPQIERSEEVSQSERSEEVPLSAVQENQSAVQADVGQVQIAKGAKLSVAAKLLIPPDFEGEHFRMAGISVGTPPGLSLDLVDRRGGTFVFALMALIALMIVWFSGRHSLWKIWVLLGVCLPLGLGGLIPPLYHVWLQAILLGTILGLIGTGLVRLVMFTCHKQQCRAIPLEKKAISTLFLIAICLGGSVQGEEKTEAKPEKPAIAPIIQTFSDPAHPESSDQVWVPWEKYLELRSQSGNPLNGKNGTASGVYELNLKADFPKPDSKQTEIVFQARISLYSDAQGETRIPLPIRRGQIANAKLDGADARLVFQEGDNSSQAVIVPAKGDHVLDLNLRVSVQHGDITRGDLRLPIRGPVAGSCELKCSTSEINLFVDQPGGLLRSSLEGGGVSYRFTLGNSIDPQISWRPAMNPGDEAVQGEISSVLEVGSILQVTEILRLTQLKRGLSEVLFELPAGVLPTNVSGQEIEGWELQLDGEKRRVRVFLKTTELRTLLLTLTYAVIPAVGDDGVAEFEFSPVTPVGFSPTRNRIGIVTDDERQLTQPVNPGWKQIHPDELADAELQNFHPRLSKGSAWEQTSGMAVPFKLSWKTHAEEVEILAVNRWHLRSEGARFRGTYKAEFPRYNSGWIRIPLVYGLFVDSVTWNGKRPARWFVIEDVSGDPSLVISPDTEFAEAEEESEADNSNAKAAPQGEVSRESTLVVDAWFPLEPVDLEEFQFPVVIPRDATKRETFVGISNDPSLRLDLVAEGWKPIDPASRQVEFGIPLPAFAYESDELEPTGVEVRGTPSYPTIRGTTLTILDVRDDALDYLLAFQWEVLNGESSTFVFRGPDWLKERIEFVPPAGQKPPLVSVESLSGNLAQWTVTFDVPQRDKVFQIAKATLPVPTDGFVRCPALQLVDRIPPGDWKPLETQTHFQSVVNHSRNQLTLQSEPHHVRAHPDELQRAIQVPTPLLVQSIDLLREVEPLKEPVWKATPVEKTAVIPASIGLATHSFWITGDDTWRSRVIYRVTNRRRQYLPVEIPASSRILSASAAGEAVRVLSRDVDGKKIHLIPLPKMSAGDLPFDVSLTLAGRLAVKNPLWGNPTTIDVPLAHVVLPGENGELGIDVTRENVEIFYPERISATLVEDTTRTNVQSVGEESRMLDEIETLLGEMSELAELGSSYNKDYQSQSRARSNLKNLTESLDQARQKLEVQKSKESQSGNEQVIRRSLQIQQQVDELDRKLGVIKQEEGVNQNGNGILKDNSSQGKIDVSNRFQEGNTADLYNLNQKAASSRDPSSKPNDSFWEQKEDVIWSSQADVPEGRKVSKGRFSNRIDADRPRHNSAYVKNREMSFGGGGGGFGGGGGDGDVDSKLEMSVEEKAMPGLSAVAPPQSAAGKPMAEDKPQSQESSVEEVAPVAQPSEPSQKRVATLVSLEIDFQPTGRKQTFSRLQGGAKVALRLWPHEWFAGVIRVVWFIAMLSLGASLVLLKNSRKIVPITSLIVVLVVAALFGTAKFIALMCLLTLVAIGLLLITNLVFRKPIQS